LKYLNVLLDDDNVVLADQVVADFDSFMTEAFEYHHKEKKEGQKVEVLQTIRKLVNAYYEQKLKPFEADQIEKLEKCRKITFVP
jgi:hypothetical protein